MSFHFTAVCKLNNANSIDLNVLQIVFVFLLVMIAYNFFNEINIKTYLIVKVNQSFFFIILVKYFYICNFCISFLYKVIDYIITKM